MLYLLDLPPENLCNVAEKIPIRSHTSHLLICKRWYHTVLPTFLATPRLQKDIHLSANDLERFPPRHGQLYDRIKERVERLSIRLLGHASNDTATDFQGDKELFSSDDMMQTDNLSSSSEGLSEETDDENSDVGSISSDTELNAEHRRPSSPKLRDTGETRQRVLYPWRDRIDKKLVDLSETLPHLGLLREMVFEALSEIDEEKGWQWDYLFLPTVQRFVMAVPSTVRILLLDLSGSDCITAGQSTTEHLCSTIARRLGDFEEVRLRMRTICPMVFGFPRNRGIFEDGENEDGMLQLTSSIISSDCLALSTSRLKRMVLKLSLPFFTQQPGIRLDAEGCADFEYQDTLICLMSIAGCAYARVSPQLERLKITCYSHNHSFDNSNLEGIDCVRRAYYWQVGGHSRYEDDGLEWDGWEEEESELGYRPIPFKSTK